MDPKLCREPGSQRGNMRPTAVFASGILCVLFVSLGCDGEKKPATAGGPLAKVFLQLGRATDLSVVCAASPLPPVSDVMKLDDDASAVIPGRPLSEAVEHARSILRTSGLPAMVLIKPSVKPASAALNGIQGMRDVTNAVSYMAKVWKAELECSSPTWRRMKDISFAIDEGRILGVLVGWVVPPASKDDGRSPDTHKAGNPQE